MNKLSSCWGNFAEMDNYNQQQQIVHNAKLSHNLVLDVFSDWNWLFILIILIVWSLTVLVKIHSRSYTA